MNDINWRNINEDHTLFLEDNRYRRILIETDVSFRIALGLEIDKDDYEYYKETVKRYAYIE